MSHIQKNIRYLRKQDGLTQEAFSGELGINRPKLAAYEEGRAKPGFELLQKLAERYQLSLDDLIRNDLEVQKFDTKAKGNNFKVLSITVDSEQKENIEMVPVKARAGYLSGYQDTEYIKNLAKFQLPFLSNGTYRAFEIEGDSMMPLPNGSIVVGEYIEALKDIKDGHTYILITRNEGIVYKRVFNRVLENKTLILHSDNISYPAYSIEAADVMEIWKAVMHMSYANKDAQGSFNNIVNEMQALKAQMEILKGES